MTEDKVAYTTVAVAILAFSAVLFLLGGCPKPLPSPVPDLNGIPYCVFDNNVGLPGVGDLCDGLSTDVGFQCVTCAGAHGCIDKIDMVYCVSTGCSIDPRCQRGAVHPHVVK